MVDPIGVAGFIVGLPGLITSCVDLYKLMVTAHNFEYAVRIVVHKVSVEQLKFAYWLQDVGFTEGARTNLKLSPVTQETIKRQLELLRG